MTDYIPPIRDMRFAMYEVAGLRDVLQLEQFAHFDTDTVDQVLDEAGRFATEVLAPLNASGDREGCDVEDRAVIVALGFADAYQQFVDNGWQSLAASGEYDGMGFPEVTGTAVSELWQAANLSFALCPMLTAGAIVAIEAHGSDALKNLLLPKLVSGAWSGTMNLTEPQAGSDLSAVTTKAIPDGEHYRIHGTKIYITWGDHPMAENIIHLVLARIDGAPEGVRGLSLFAVPKYRLDSAGQIGDINDVYPASVEHKLGIHASPTCVMNFGEKEGALGYLIGDAGRGLACMFTMMNHARLNVGVQGLAISERALQLAQQFALERVQGRAPGQDGRVSIVHHADVRRMLMLMRSQVEAMRAAAYATAAFLDIGHHGESAESRTAADQKMALLTPVIKGWLTEVAQEITSLGIQIHGGMGYVEETGAAQFYRDARILTIYEGTTGIQANDLVGRKILGDEGRAAQALIEEMRDTARELVANGSLVDLGNSLAESAQFLADAVQFVVAKSPSDPSVPGAASVNLLMLFGTVLGGWQIGRSALAAQAAQASGGGEKAFYDAKIQTANFYGAQVLPRSYAYLKAATSGSQSLPAAADLSD